MYSFIDTNNPVNVPLNPHFERKTVSFFQNHGVFVSFSQNHLWSYPLISSKTKILTIFQWPNLAAILIGVSPAEFLTAFRFPTKEAKNLTISLFPCSIALKIGEAHFGQQLFGFGLRDHCRDRKAQNIVVTCRELRSY